MRRRVYHEYYPGVERELPQIRQLDRRVETLHEAGDLRYGKMDAKLSTILLSNVSVSSQAGSLRNKIDGWALNPLEQRKEEEPIVTMDVFPAIKGTNSNGDWEYVLLDWNLKPFATFPIDSPLIEVCPRVVGSAAQEDTETVQNDYTPTVSTHTCHDDFYGYDFYSYADLPNGESGHTRDNASQLNVNNSIVYSANNEAVYELRDFITTTGKCEVSLAIDVPLPRNHRVAMVVQHVECPGAGTPLYPQGSTVLTIIDNTFRAPVATGKSQWATFWEHRDFSTNLQTYDKVQYGGANLPPGYEWGDTYEQWFSHSGGVEELNVLINGAIKETILGNKRQVTSTTTHFHSGGIDPAQTVTTEVQGTGVRGVNHFGDCRARTPDFNVDDPDYADWPSANAWDTFLMACGLWSEDITVNTEVEGFYCVYNDGYYASARFPVDVPVLGIDVDHAHPSITLVRLMEE